MSRLTFSIVINTYNRATSLVNTLESMFYLRHPAYEVIVVNGPSTDHTQALIEQYAENIKIGQCAETNLAKSRNIGIGMASGDIVCFIDDDGIPEPDWLDQLEQVYLAHPEAGGVGGFVRDHTGVDYQTKYIVCNRQGEAQFYYDEMDASVVPQSPWQARYPSLIGVNSSFRRQALLQIGGFDEEYAYFLDETDVCVRLVDAGWQIMFAPKAEKFKERFRAVSGMLIEQIDNMAAIASAFSDFAKMSEAHNETFEVDELVRNCSLLFKNNTEELECDVEEGIRILADREQMRRVLINLLKNAEQSIPEGRQGVIRITVRKKEGKVEIRIRDNGQGIPENLREKIFQPNFTTKSSGMGLGLAICKRIIESMGGEIGFVSEVGVGTEFFIILDIVRA